METQASGGSLDHKVSPVPEETWGPRGYQVTVFLVRRGRTACRVVLGRRENRVRCWGRLLETQGFWDSLER